MAAHVSSSCPGADTAEDGEQDCVWLEQQLQTSAVPHCSPQSLQAAMQLVNIQVLAFTPPSTLPWRVYLYTHTQCGDSDSTLILGELLYTGETNQRTVSEGAEGGGADEEEEEEQRATRPDRNQLSGKEAELREVKVTVKQQPGDERALKGLLSILATVLHTLSSEED